MLQAIDIADFDIQDTIPLYKVPNKSYIQATPSKEVFFFSHIDGMYSLCFNMFGDVVHLAAFTWVNPLVAKTQQSKK
jgi:hypothetical protein